MLLGLAVFGAYVGLSVNLSVTSDNLATTALSCVQTGPFQQVYVKVVSDRPPNRPVKGLMVSGSFLACGSPFPLEREITPGNGTVSLDVLGCSCSVGNYDVSIQNQTANYYASLNPPVEHLSQIVVVIIGIPSATIIGMHITNSGVCTGNGTTISNGTGFFC